MASVDDGDAAICVEIATPLVIEEVGPVTAHQDGRPLVEVIDAGNDVVPLASQKLLCGIQRSPSLPQAALGSWDADTGPRPSIISIGGTSAAKPWSTVWQNSTRRAA